MEWHYLLSALGGLLFVHGVIAMTRYHIKNTDTERLFAVRWASFMLCKDKTLDASAAMWGLGWIFAGVVALIGSLLLAIEADYMMLVGALLVGVAIDGAIFAMTRPKGQQRHNHRHHHREDDGIAYLSTPAEKLEIAERIARENSKKGITPPSSLDGYTPALIRKDTPHTPPSAKK